MIAGTLTRVLSHPVWTGIGGISAIVGIVIAVVGIVIAVKNSPLQPSKQSVMPPQESSIISDSIEPSRRHYTEYWNAESYYSNGLYAQAVRAYLSVIESIPQKHQNDTNEDVERIAKNAYKLDNYKLAADQLKEMLVPLAEQGVFGLKQVK